MTTDGGLFGAPRQDGPRPKLVVIGIAWAAFGVVALITAGLMSSVGIAVFGVLCVLAGGGLYAGQRARERLAEDERSWRSDPGGYAMDDLEPDPGPEDVPAEEDADRHATRVMSTASPDEDVDEHVDDDHHDDRPGRGGHDADDIVDAEYTEYYEPSPSEQDDGTGYDDEELAYRRRREDEWARESRAREDDTQVIEADDDEDGVDHPDRAGQAAPTGEGDGGRPTRDAPR